MRKIALLLLTLFLLVSLSGCSKGEKISQHTVAEKQVLNWNYPAELTTLDPSKVSDSYSGDIVGNTMEGLYRLGNNNKLVPALGVKTKVEAGGLKYTFSLRKGAKWSNGDPVTASDFVYGWQRTLQKDTASPSAYLFSGVKNADAIIAGNKKVTSLGVTAKDDHTLVVELEKKLPYFESLLTIEAFLPQNKRAVETYGEKYGSAAEKMVYNGPFVVKNWTGTEKSWQLVKNEQYWDKQKVKLSTINFKVNKSTTKAYKLYQAGKLDYLTLSSKQATKLKKDPGYSVLKQARTSYLDFNQTKTIFKNLKIRQALSYAIDRDKLVKQIVGGGAQTSLGIVPQGLYEYKGRDFAEVAQTTAGVTGNKQRAKWLFKQGLAELGVKQLSFTLMSSDDETAKKVAQFIKEELEETLPNVQVTVQSVSLKQRIAQGKNGSFDIQLTSWGADFADPLSFLALFTTENSYNFGGWNNTKYNELIKTAQTTDANNKAKRFEDLVKASKLLSEKQGVIPLYQANIPQLKRETIKGLIQNSAGTTNNWKEVYLVK
ncbi:MAG: peptide ABC transporter substrate-binding protein [Lactobacillus sp.]|nr:peptide ABC transporter substrate-binding protein [Lactobacillus sp.]